MVQSNGTRFDSQRFKSDFTGRKKYSGRSSERRRVGAAGEMEARRAMPTSGAGACSSQAGAGTASGVSTAAFWKSGMSRRNSPFSAGASGGQSASRVSGLSDCNPDLEKSRTPLPGAARGASSPVRWFGLCSGLTGKRDAAEVRARRRAVKPDAVGEGKERNTGDIAHLGTRRVFRFLFAMSRTISYFLRHRLASLSFASQTLPYLLPFGLILGRPIHGLSRDHRSRCSSSRNAPLFFWPWPSA